MVARSRKHINLLFFLSQMPISGSVAFIIKKNRFHVCMKQVGEMKQTHIHAHTHIPILSLDVPISSDQIDFQIKFRCHLQPPSLPSATIQEGREM